MPNKPKIMSIGGNFQLAEHARMFGGLGVVYVQPRGTSRVNPIRANNNSYNVITLKPEGNFDLEKVCLIDALSLGEGDGKSRFLEYAKSSDLELISIGVSDGVLKNQPHAQIWSDLAVFLYNMFEKQGNSKEISILSSDNAFNNGYLLRRNVLSAIALNPSEPYAHNPKFVQWFRSNVHTHNCVVDRMVMAKPGEAALPILNKMKINPDELTLYTEPIPSVSHKLIVEDITGRLDNIIKALIEEERANAIKTSTFPFAVVKYEALNFFHTAQVHWGYIAGLADIYSNLQHPVLGPYVRKAAEAKTNIVSKYSLFKGTGIDVVALTNEFADRCNNPHLGHRNEFIVRNGTGKIIERIQGSLKATNGEVDNGMYGTIASIIREKTPIRTEEGEKGPTYIGMKDTNEEYKIEDTDPFIMQTMLGVNINTEKEVVGNKVKEILAHIGLSGLSPKLQHGITKIVYDLLQRPALEVLKDYTNKCFE